VTEEDGVTSPPPPPPPPPPPGLLMKWKDFRRKGKPVPKEVRIDSEGGTTLISSSMLPSSLNHSKHS